MLIKNEYNAYSSAMLKLTAQLCNMEFAHNRKEVNLTNPVEQCHVQHRLLAIHHLQRDPATNCRELVSWLGFCGKKPQQWPWFG